MPSNMRDPARLLKLVYTASGMCCEEGTVMSYCTSETVRFSALGSGTDSGLTDDARSPRGGLVCAWMWFTMMELAPKIWPEKTHTLAVHLSRSGSST